MSEKTNMIKRSLTAKQGWVTRLVNEGKQLINNSDLTSSKLQRLIDDLKTKWSSYATTLEQLEVSLTAQEDTKGLDQLLTDQEEIEINYRNDLQVFESHLDSLNKVNLPIQPSFEQPKLTLPTISLPEFSGNISEWPSFWDKFNGLIHQRSDIPKISKFSYLLGQLKGTAHMVVSELSVTEDNYEVAISLLKKNYDDKDQITTKLVEKLLDLASPNHNYKELQHFRISVNSIVESLKINNNVKEAEWILNRIIQRKLNKKTNDMLYLKYSKNNFTLKEIDESLLDICKALSYDETPKNTNTNRKDNKANPKSKPPYNEKVHKYPNVSTGSVGYDRKGFEGLNP